MRPGSPACWSWNSRRPTKPGVPGPGERGLVQKYRACSGGAAEVAVVLRQHLPARKEGVGGNGVEPAREHGVMDLRYEVGGERNCEKEGGECEERVDRPHGQKVAEATEIAGEQPDRDADEE